MNSCFLLKCGTYVFQIAFRAFGSRSLANGTTEGDEPMIDVKPVISVHDPHEVKLCFNGVGCIYEPQLIRYAQYVSVDNYRRFPENVAADNVGGLASYARKTCK